MIFREGDAVRATLSDGTHRDGAVWQVGTWDVTVKPPRLDGEFTDMWVMFDGQIDAECFRPEQLQWIGDRLLTAAHTASSNLHNLVHAFRGDGDCPPIAHELLAAAEATRAELERLRARARR